MGCSTYGRKVDRLYVKVALLEAALGDGDLGGVRPDGANKLVEDLQGLAGSLTGLRRCSPGLDIVDVDVDEDEDEGEYEMDGRGWEKSQDG
jgi:hypothetical protein